MSRKSFRIVMLAALLAVLAVQPALADFNLVQNGSFETGPAIPVFSSGLFLNPGDTRITSWTIIDNATFYAGSAWQSSEGQRSIGLGTVNTTINTQVGQTYLVSFDLAGDPNQNLAAVKSLTVEVGGNNGVQRQDFFFDTTGKTISNMGWTSKQWTFTAMETATPLFFSSNPGGAVLDNVVVKPLSLLLTNGSFEVGPLSSTTLNTGDTSMAPWTVGGSGVTFQRSDVGQAYLYLNSSSGPGSISQDIATIPGEVYQVSFNMGGGSGFPISLRSLQVQAAGQTQDFLSIALTRKQWTFKANAATTTLTFQSLNSGPLGASLDKVEVVHPGNPVLNGSFEKNSYVIPPAPFYLLSYGSARITYWTVGGPSLDYIPAAYWQTSQGGFSIDLNGIATGSIEQTFLTTPGVDYRVTFALAGNPEDGPAVKNLRVTAAGRSQDYTFDTTGKSVTNMGWTNKTFSFTAQWPTTTLSFQSLTNGTNAGPALDNVRLSKVRGLPPLMLLLD